MTRLSLKWLLACMLISGSAMAAENTPDQLTDARIAATPPTIGANSFYISNGPVLAASMSTMPNARPSATDFNTLGAMLH